MTTLNLVRFSSTKKQARQLLALEERFLFASLYYNRPGKRAYKKLAKEYVRKCDVQEPQATWADYFMSAEYDI